MNQNEPPTDLPESVNANDSCPVPANRQPTSHRLRYVSQVLYWCKIVIQPVIAVAAILAIVFALSFAQKMGYLNSAESQDDNVANVDDGTVYFCPMNCVLPMKAPGRCPVCGMELKPRRVSGDPQDRYGLTVSPSARRLSNIQTVVAVTMPLTKDIRAMGRIRIDESSEAQIPAFIEGRLEKMLVDYTGARVRRGEELAILYSPDLYSAQIEFLAAKKALDENLSTKQRIVDANRRVFQSARKRLSEFGLPAARIDELERTGKANSRIRIVSPMSGTVTEKLAVELDYVKTGTPLFKVADLTKVWLMVELFPEDAVLVRYGQEVSVSLPSQPGRDFQGRVAFVDPMVDPKSGTVPVRVVIPNEAGLFRIGDFAEARIVVDIAAKGERLVEIYDPSLAGKWISPKHPYIVRDRPGKCPECGVDLVPASQLGFVSYRPKQQGAVVVPRQAVLISAQASVAYVETKPGRFEFRKVEVGPIAGDLITVVSGIEPGEHVVAQGAFMLDAEFNQSSKPSLIDPERAILKDESGEGLTPRQLKQIDEAFTSLSPENRKLAEEQQICPVTEFALGTMGTPIKIDVNGRDVMICCEGCRKKLLENPNEFLATLDKRKLSPEEAKEIEEAMSQLSAEDRKIAEAQVFCPVAEFRLGSMGKPIKVDVQGQPVFICCEGCREGLLKQPAEHLEKIEGYKKEKQGIPPASKDKRSDASPPTDRPPGDNEKTKEAKEIEEAMSLLSAEDRKIAEAQVFCPVAEFRLGSMGKPIKVDVQGQPVFICCEGCREMLLKQPAEHLEKIEGYKKEKQGIPPASKDKRSDASPPTDPPPGDNEKTKEAKEIEEAMSQLSAEDRKIAEAQVFCPVAEFRLGSMGKPIKVDVQGQPVFICCEGCREVLLKQPAEHLEKIEGYKQEKQGIPPASEQEKRSDASPPTDSSPGDNKKANSTPEPNQ